MCLCYIKLGNLKKALSISKKLKNSCPNKYKAGVTQLRNLLKNEEVVSNKYKKKGVSVMIEPFDTAHRLCKYFPLVEFNLPSGNSFLARLSFSFPFVKPPNMIPNVDESILYNEFGQHKNDLLVPSPQALWIKVNQFRDKKRPGHTNSRPDS